MRQLTSFKWRSLNLCSKAYSWFHNWHADLWEGKSCHFYMWPVIQIRYLQNIYFFNELQHKLFLHLSNQEIWFFKNTLPVPTLRIFCLETNNYRQPEEWNKVISREKWSQQTACRQHCLKRKKKFMGNPSCALVLWDILYLCKTGTTSTFQVCPSLSPRSTLSSNNSSSTAKKVKGSASPLEIRATGSTESASIKPDT